MDQRMRRRRRYYLARLHKTGRLNDQMLIQALMSPAIVETRGYGWTFSDCSIHTKDTRTLFVFAQLSKFHPEGVVRVLDAEHRTQGLRIEPNLLIATSPFIYIPEFSGIAYQHVWNQIERNVFTKRFSDIVRASHDNFFVDCEIEPITDLRTFVAKLEAIDSFLEISAKVYPPNPLFGRAWANLKEYLDRRRASELDLKEKGDEANPIRTKVVYHIRKILDEGQNETAEMESPPDVTDAALLMAADGYGSGKVVGKEGPSTVTLRTSETQKSFLFAGDPTPQELFDEAFRHFSRLSDERHMGH